MIVAHTVGEHLFDIAHHAVIFGIGIAVGVVFGARQIIVNKRKNS